jgi:serine/threonine protein kinase
MGCALIKKREEKSPNKSPKQLKKSYLNISNICVNDVLDPTSNLFYCTINGLETNIVYISLSVDIDKAKLRTYSKIYNENPNMFTTIQHYENGWYSYIIYNNAEVNIETLLNQEKQFNEAELRKIATELLKSIQILNNNKVLHKNIYCANIFLTQNGHYVLGIGDITTVSPALRLLYHTKNQEIMSNGLLNDGFFCDMWSLGNLLLNIIIGNNYENIPASSYFTDVIQKPLQLEDAKIMVSKECYDFISNLLQANPISLEEALEHQWINSNKPGNNFSRFLNKNSTQTEANKAIQKIVSSLINSPDEVENLFKMDWEIDSDVFKSMFSLESPHIEQIKFSVINCLKLYKEEILYREYVELIPDPINMMESIRKQIPTIYGSNKEISDNYITESFTFMEYILLKRSHQICDNHYVKPINHENEIVLAEIGKSQNANKI